MANYNAKPPKQGMWKKGQSGNPKGGLAHDPALKKLKRLTKDEMIEIGSMVVKGSVASLRAIAKDPNESALKCMMAAVAVRTIVKGDPKALDALLNRLIGKVKDEVHVSNPDGTLRDKLSMSQAERAALIATMEKRLKK